MPRRVESGLLRANQIQECLGVAPTHGSLVAVLVQPGEGERLDGTKHPEARAAGRPRDGHDQVVVGELEQVIEAVGGTARRNAHRVDLLQVEAAFEDGQLVQ